MTYQNLYITLVIYFLEGKMSMIYFYLRIQKILVKELWCQIAWVQPLVLPYSSGP